MIGEIEVKEGALYLPINHYRKRGGQKITTLGAIHLGSPSYYDELQEKINEIDFGFFEGIKKSEIKEVSAERQKYFESIGKLSQQYENFAKWVGLVTQKDQLKYNNWVNPDLTMAEFINLMPEKELERFSKIASDTRLEEELGFVYTNHPKELSKVLKDLALFAYKHTNLLRFLPVIAVYFKEGQLSLDPYGANKFILQFRNEHLFEELSKELESPSQDEIGIIYGAAHLTGIDKYLRKKGFKRDENEKIKAWEPDGKGLRYIDAVKAVIMDIEELDVKKGLGRRSKRFGKLGRGKI